MLPLPPRAHTHSPLRTRAHHCHPPALPAPVAQRGKHYIWTWVDASKGATDETLTLLKTCLAQLQALSAKAATALAAAAPPGAAVAAAESAEAATEAPAAALAVDAPVASLSTLLEGSGTALTPLPSRAVAAAATSAAPAEGAPLVEAPKPVDFARVAKAVQAGESLPGIRTIESRLSSHAPTASVMASRPKPWESSVADADAEEQDRASSRLTASPQAE